MDAEKLSIDVEADTGEATAELTSFALQTQALVTALNALTAEIKLDIDTRGLRPKVTAATKAAGAGQEVNVPVKTSGLDRVQGGLKSLGNTMQSTARKSLSLRKGMMVIIAPLVLSLINVAIGALGGLGVAALGAASTLSAMGGVMATLPGLFGGLIAGIGGLMGALKPIGGALKAFKQQETSAAKASAGGAKTTESAAKRRQAAAKQVERATRTLAKAQEDAAEGVEDATERVTQAEENLQDAQRDARDAQDDLTRARKEAAETYKDLQAAAEGAALAERRARLRLMQIQQAQASGAAGFAADATAQTVQQADAMRRLIASQEGLGQSELDREDASLDLAEAQLAVRNAAEERIEAEERLNSAKTKGVEGDDRVVAAHRRVEDSSREVIRANRGLVESQDAVTEAQVEGSERIRDAQEALADAMESMAEAAEDAGSSGAAAFQPFDDAMSKLTPLGRELVKVLLSFKEPLRIMREAIEQASFPQIISGLTNIRNFLPTLTPLIAGAAGEIGTFFKNWTELVTSPAFSRDLVEFGTSNNRVLKDLGVGFVGLTDAFMSVVTAAAPLTEWLGKLFATFGQNLAASMNLKQESGQLRDTFLRVREATALWFGNMRQLVGVFKDILQAAFPMGMELGGIFKTLIDRTREWTSSAEGQSRMKETFQAYVPLIRELGSLFLELGRALGSISFSNIEETTEVSKDMRKGMIPAFRDLLKSVEDLGPKISDFFTSLARLLNALPISALGVFFIVLKQVMDVFVQILKIPGMTELVSVLLAMKGAMMAFGLIAKVVSPLIGLLTNIAGLFTTVIGPALGTLAMFLGISIAALFAWIAVIVLVAVVIWKNWDTIKEAFGKAWQFIQMVWDKILDAFGAAIGAIGRFFGRIPEMLGNLIGSLGSFIGRMIDKGREIIGGLWDGIQNAAGRVWDFFTGIPGRILGAIGDAGRMLMNAGRQIVEGLGEGLKQGWDFVRRAWNWIIEKIPGGLADFLKISSPSKVMMTMGQQITQGLAIGIRQGGAEVIAEMTALNRHLVAEGSMTATMGASGAPGALRAVSGMGGGVNVGGVTLNVDARGASDPNAVGAAVMGSGEDMVAELLRVIRSA